MHVSLLRLYLGFLLVSAGYYWFSPQLGVYPMAASLPELHIPSHNWWGLHSFGVLLVPNFHGIYSIWLLRGFAFVSM